MNRSVILLNAVLLLLATGSLRGADSVYVKRATAAETRAASVAAIDESFGVRGVKQSGWKVVGPFDNARGAGVKRAFPPEERVDLNAEYLGLNGQRIRWQDAPEFADDTYNNLDRYPQNYWTVTYVHRVIDSDRERSATLYLGSDDTIAVWLNGQKVHEWAERPRGVKRDDDVVPVTLRPGANTVLIKIGNFEGGYGFSYRLSLLDAAQDDARKFQLMRLEERIEADFTKGEPEFYRLESVEIPSGISLEVGGLAVRSDGRVFICTRRGEVWLANLATREWKLFASGLHEPLGILVENDHQILVAQRPELTRLKDTNRDGVADEFETVLDLFGVSGNYHEYHYGPVRDAAGNLYGTLNLSWAGIAYSGAPLRGWAYQITPQGQFVPFALGLRSPNGLGVSPDGDVFVIDSQGEWFGGSPLIHLQRGKFYGHPGSLVWTQNYNGPQNPNQIDPKSLEPFRTPPAAWFVYGPLGQSPGQPLWDTTGGKFGPFGGQLFAGDQSKSVMLRAALEKVGGEWQGAIFPFRSGYASGLVRSAWLPDGSLLSGMTDRGWSSIGGRPFGLQKTIWTGKVPMEILAMKLTPTGFDVTFTQPLDPATATKPAAWSFTHFHYLYHAQYGSPKQAETPVSVREVKLSADGKTASVTLGEMISGKIYELHLNGVKSAGGDPVQHPEAYYTLNKVAGK